MWVLIQALRKLSLGAPGPVTKISRAKKGQKWMILNQYISGNTNTDEKWFVIFEHTINRLSFAYVRLHQPEYFFLFCFFFFLLFLFTFLCMPSTFKPLNALCSKFERSKISERTSVRLKSVVPG